MTFSKCIAWKKYSTNFFVTSYGSGYIYALALEVNLISLRIANNYHTFLQHYPLYRASDAACSGPDAAPAEQRAAPFREHWECLSQEASHQVSFEQRAAPFMEHWECLSQEASQQVSFEHRAAPFREHWECLSQEASYQVSSEQRTVPFREHW